MELKYNIEVVILNLLERYKEVEYLRAEYVALSKNSVRSSYSSKEVCNDDEVSHIQDISTLFGEVASIEVTFKIKHKGHRKIRNHKEYFRLEG